MARRGEYTALEREWLRDIPDSVIRRQRRDKAHLPRSEGGR